MLQPGSSFLAARRRKRRKRKKKKPGWSLAVPGGKERAERCSAREGGGE